MKKVLLLLANGFEFMEASVFIDVIGWNLVQGDGTTELFTCGLQKEVKSSFNQRMLVDFLVDAINVEEFDALAIPGGFEIYGFYNDAFDSRFLDLIRAFRDRQKAIASVCVGALPVAKSGILKNKNGTTYRMNPVRINALKEMGVNVIDEPVVVDDRIITSWNPSTAPEVAFRLLELLTSKKNTDKIREAMGF